MKYILYIIFLSITITIISHSLTSPSEERFKESGYNSNFNFDTNQSFEKYIEHSREIIRKGKIFTEKDNKKKIVDRTSSFILESNNKNCYKQEKSKRKGILLVHGLLNTTFDMLEIGRFFQQNCFTVYSILLTGHGTRPGDLLKISYKDWIAQVEYGVKELSKKVDKIYLGGHSVGGALSINHILSNPLQKIEGLIGIAPSIKIDSRAKITPIIKLFKKYRYIFKDDNPVRYQSITYNSIVQVYLLTKKINKKLQKDNSALKNIKAFLVFTNEDTTIDTSNTLNSILNNTNPNTRHIILYHQNKLSNNLVNQQNLYTISSTIKSQKILNLSHISITHNPENFFTGKEGYRDCLHYYHSRRKNQNYSLCKSSSDVNYGEITLENLKKGVMVRLSYNPFFKDLLSNLDRFINEK